MSTTHKRVLLLLAHPSQHRSEVNIPLFNAAKAIDGVTAVDLYGEYPTFDIDIECEQQRLIEHDIVIFQFPLYWYSTPAILKEWQDLVLEYGFAYGTDGTALKGKTFFCAVSAGGKEDAYQAQGYNHFTVRQLLAPLEQTASLTGMHYLAPLVLFGARTAIEDDFMVRHIGQWQRLLKALVEDRVNVHLTAKLDCLNHHLDTIIERER